MFTIVSVYLLEQNLNVRDYSYHTDNTVASFHFRWRNNDKMNPLSSRFTIYSEKRYLSNLKR